MNKKTIIQLVVIIGAFLGAGLVLYNGLFKDSIRPTSSSSSMTTAQGNQNILPYGDSLDFSVLDKQNLLYKQMEYPKLDAKNDFGIPEDELIKAPKVK